MSETVVIHKDMLIGDIIKIKPEAATVIEKYFGKGCFTCPGINMETITFGATMHGSDADAMVRDINAA